MSEVVAGICLELRGPFEKRERLRGEPQLVVSAADGQQHVADQLRLGSEILLDRQGALVE